VRAPTFLGTLGAPLIIGPVGGGVLEAVRDVSNATIELNPIVRQGLRNAGVIFAKTTHTKGILSPRLRAKTYVQMELGVTPAQIGAPRPIRQTPRRLLYAGRLATSLLAIFLFVGLGVALQTLQKRGITRILVMNGIIGRMEPDRAGDRRRRARGTHLLPLMAASIP
jgi:hypothetical protein